MIKGNTKPSGATSYKETVFGIISRSKLLPLEIEGTKRGLEYIHSLIESNKDVEITPRLICEVHAISFQWIFSDWAGSFRTIQVTYSGKEAPHYFQIPELVENLCSDLKVQLDNLPTPKEIGFIDKVVATLSWFQHRFVFIHPFQDYNGRVARMLTILLLLKLRLPATEIKVESKEDREKYLLAMQAGDEGDLSSLEILLSENLTRQLEKSL